ncbi:MAG: hypothetical protein JRJ45_07830, partial [Deltaproteobacteria bacterium]|nr:hypothetical protein [Deltaproteobacteria bacterium]
MGNNGFNMPGPGDEATWGPCTNHPNDPRTPEAPEIDDVWENDDFMSKVNDLDGSFMECFTEMPDETLLLLVGLLKAKNLEGIGNLIHWRVEDYLGE